MYIDLSVGKSAKSHEISEGLVLDYDIKGKLIGIDIDNTNKKIDLSKLQIMNVPADVYIKN